MKGWVFEDDDSISVGDFVEWFYLKGGDVDGFNKDKFSMHHISKSRRSKSLVKQQFLASWYPHRRAKNVLWLHFEDIIEHLRSCVKLVAEFLEIGADDNELQKLVTKQVCFIIQGL